MIVRTTTPEKKRAAITAAVMAYIRTEEDMAAAVMAQGISASAKAVETPPAAPMKLWGFSGRQDQMRNMNMMQLKAFHR